MPDLPVLHVHALGDGAWGVYSPVAGNGPRLIARCGGPDAEANARLFARAPALRTAAAPFACWYQDLADSEKAEHSMVQRISSLGGGKAPTKGDLRALREALGEGAPA